MSNSRGARIRSVVFVLEGGVTRSPDEWSSRIPALRSIPWHRTFPDWERASEPRSGDLREMLGQRARTGTVPIRPQLRELLETIGSWSGVYRSVLSGGPREWVEELLDHHDLGGLLDDVFHHDRYPHGDRRVLLKFLQNRFVANGPRTLLVGGLPEDETLAERERTRFVSPEPAPDSTDRPGRWEWSTESLLRYLDARRPAPSADHS